MGDPTSALVDQIRVLPAQKAFRAYVELLAQSPDHAQIAALALREKARAGELADEHIPVLEACLKDAPDIACTVHLAKALAAFGRKAQRAAPVLAAKINDLHVLDDSSYWVLDGCLFALGFLGGKAALDLVRELGNERPNRAVRSDSVFKGEMSRDVRQQRFVECLERVRALIDQRDPGTWREKKTTLVPKKQKDAGAPKKSWMVR